MKILQIINSLGTGGAEKLLLETIPLYREKGIEMDVLLLWDNDLPFTKALRELNCCKIYILSNGPGYKNIYNPLHIFKIRKYIKKYDAIHVHLFPAQYFVAIANFLNGNKVRLFFTEHSISNRRFRSRIYRQLDRVVYNLYDRIICISEEVENMVISYAALGHQKTELIKNGVNIGRYTVAQPYYKFTFNEEFKEKDIVLIQISSFHPPKDQLTLIRALLLLPERYKLILVGVGEQIQQIKDTVTDLGLNQRVIFLGQRMDIPQLLKSSDIVVLSSKYEGLSLSSIEGMASGKPFVASDVPGLREVVKDAGVLFRQGNSAELAVKIKELMEDKTYYQSVANACLERANQFDISIMVEKHIALYKTLYEA